MLLRFKKTPDGVVLACLRDNGSVAVQRTRQGGFFAFHDLMHYSVETVLGLDRAFLGLMGAGWEFGTFGDREDHRYLSMPVEALWAEHLVGTLTRLYGDGAWRDPELLPALTGDINGELGAATAAKGPVPLLKPGDVAAIYERFGGLVARWAEVAVGGHLELPFGTREPAR